MEYSSQDQDQGQEQGQDRDQEHQDQNQSSNPPPSLDERCTDLPFLLHALYHLEPNPQTSRTRQKAYDQSQWHAIPREALQILTVISQLFATTGNSEVAVTMYTLSNKVVVFFAASEVLGVIEEGYVCVIGEMVRSIARGEYGRIRVRGRRRRREVMHTRVYEEMMIIVVGRCRDRILWLFEGLAAEVWDSGVSLLDRYEEDGEGVGWEKVADLAAGNTKLTEFVDSRKGYEDMEVEVVDGAGEWVRVEVKGGRRIYCFPEDDTLPFNQKFQHPLSDFRNEPVQEDVRNENMAWEYISNDKAPPRALTPALQRLMPTKMSSAERGRFFRALRQGLISFLGAIRSKDFRETDNDKLWEYMRVADLIYKKRTELEPLVKFTDEQMEWVNKIARYPRAAEFIIRRAYTPQYQKMLSNLEIHELIPKAPEPPDQSLAPPPQTTVLEILEWVERRYAGPPYRLLISPPSIKLKYPNADPRAIWTPNPPPDKHCVHPEVAIMNFIYNYGIYNFNTPFVVYGVSGVCCWACDLYADIVHKTMLAHCINGFHAERIYKEGWTGKIPKGDGWYVPIDGEGDREFREKVAEVVEDCLKVIVGNTRKAWIER
ncbi:hypothetical protein TWF703_010612 [Orbilia oligospora]|uniref:Uncharacterized protein n=2 Tax=Orbilia oligospora TaxID=2813651 RepID=A0A7C8NND7_ORBOL|nr:hypothetical protein TWF703_010612 [Orbilia oligospora]